MHRAGIAEPGFVLRKETLLALALYHGTELFYSVSLTSQQALGQEKREQHVAKDKRFLPSLISFHSLKGIHTINITRAARGVT